MKLLQQPSLLLIISLFTFNVFSNEYRWLERYYGSIGESSTPLTERQSEWLENLDKERDEFINTLNESSVVDEISKYWEKSRSLKKIKLDNGNSISLELTENAEDFRVVIKDVEDKISDILIDRSSSYPLSRYNIHGGVGDYLSTIYFY